MLAALHKHNTKATTPPELRVPVPQVFVLCEDIDVIGTPFYLMEFLDGRIFTDMSMPGVTPEVRREWCVILPRSSRAPSDLTKTLLRKPLLKFNTAGSPPCVRLARSPRSTRTTSAYPILARPSRTSRARSSPSPKSRARKPPCGTSTPESR